jgi:hypothetical protein
MTTCRHCGRRIERDAADVAAGYEGRWIDPEATGDDSIWRETCDQHDTFTAEHEPLGDEQAAFTPADGEWHRITGQTLDGKKIWQTPDGAMEVQA